MNVQRITSVIICVIILSLPLVIRAQEIPTPMQKVTQTIPPEISQEPSPELSITPTPTIQISTVPSISILDTAPVVIPTSIVEENSNLDESVNTVSMELNTGDNLLDEGEITTGTAEAKIDIENKLNFNIVGTDNWAVIINQFSTEHNDLDLSHIQGSEFMNQSLITELQNENQGTVINDVTVTANTGENTVDETEGEIKTGDAVISVNIANTVNSNLIGDNTFFGVINLFEEQNGDIILPYELDFIDPLSATHAAHTVVTNSNEGEVINNIHVIANTGDNNAQGTVSAGNSTVHIQLADNLNTNIFGSNFLLLRINSYGTWNGSVDGWWGDTVSTDNGMVLSFNLPSTSAHSSNSDTEIHNTNNATIHNNLNLLANTGVNEAIDESSAIQTGDAKVTANIANTANTNIIGSNWFYSVINIFDSFAGNIIFPRPDLDISVSSNTAEIKPGEEVIFTVNYKNSGRTAAQDIVLYGDWGASWTLGTLNPGQGTSFTVPFTVPTDYHDSAIQRIFRIMTSRYEPHLTNNVFSVSLPVIRTLVSQKSATPAIITETPFLTPTTIYSPEPEYVSPHTDDTETVAESIPKTVRSIPTPSVTAQRNQQFQHLSFIDLPVTLICGLFFANYGYIIYTNHQRRKGGDA